MLTCAYITLILNFPFLQKATQAIVGLAQYNLYFLLSLPLFLFMVIVIMHSLFAWKGLTKPILIATVIVSAALFYATLSLSLIHI